MSNQKHLKHPDESAKFINIEQMCIENFPQLIRDIPATDKEKKKMPNLLYWRKFGDRKPIPILGPPVTAKEDRMAACERVQKKKVRAAVAAARKEVRQGKQKKVTTFFSRKKKTKSSKSLCSEGVSEKYDASWYNEE